MDSSRARSWRPTPLLAVSAAVHLGALAGAAWIPQRWPFAAASILATHVAMACAGMSPRSRLLGENLSRLPEAPEFRDAVALTFDDGPDPRVTPRVLEILAEREAHATFFCIGERLERHRGVAAEIVARGHRIENHTFRHSNAFALLPPGPLGREIDRAQDVIAEISGRRPVYFRAPAGMRSPWLEPLLARRGLLLTSWTRRGYDAVDSRPERVFRRLVDGLRGRDILLLHDGSTLGERRSPPVVEVLPRLLEELERREITTAGLPAEAGSTA